MGSSSENVYVGGWRHRSATSQWDQIWQMRRHHGAVGVDTLSPTLNPAHSAAIIQAISAGSEALRAVLGDASQVGPFARWWSRQPAAFQTAAVEELLSR